MASATGRNEQQCRGEYGYDLMDRPTNIAWRAAGGTLLRGFAMSYNAVGMVTNVNCSSGALPPETRAYAFDSLDRLVGERQFDAAGQSVREVSYAYDLAGNRTQATVDGVTETYTLGVGNRLASCSSGALPPETMRTYTHDAAGCVTRIARAGQPALDLAWDARYRFTAVSTNGVVVEAYGYDPLGRRAYTTTATASGSVTTWHAYDGIHCVADLDADGNVLRSYTYGPGVDNLLAITDHTTATPTTYYALTDHLGTVHALADSTGTIVESYRYDAWGNVLAVYDSSGTPIQNHKSAISNRFLFQGREHSFATGLTHFRARWYDPATGRWLSNDPIGISGGLNQYVFCGNDPVDGRDPWGLQHLEGGSGDIYRPDPFGHGKDPVTGRPLDPHVDRIPRGGGPKWRYDPNGTPRGKAPGVPKRDLPAFGKALSKLGSIISRFQAIFIVMPISYLDDIERSRSRELDMPDIVPIIPDQPMPPGYMPSPFRMKKRPCGEEVPTEYIRKDRFILLYPEGKATYA